MADGGIPEMALADMATEDVGTMAASDAAMSTIPTAVDAAGQLAVPAGMDAISPELASSYSSMFPGAYTPNDAALSQAATSSYANLPASTTQVSAGSSAPDNIDIGGGYNPATGTSLGPQGSQSGIGKLMAWAQANPLQAAGLGLSANYLFNKMATPNYLPTYTPPSAASYGLGRTLAAGYQPIRPMAEGGLTVGAGSVPTQGVAPADLMQKPNQGAGLDSLAAQYGISPQMVAQARQSYGFKSGGNVKHYDFGGFIGDSIGNAVQGVGDAVQGVGDTIGGMFGGTNNSLSVQQAGTPGAPVADPNSLAAQIAALEAQAQSRQPVSKMAGGGIAQLAVGGKLLQGPGDGMSDSIKANISGQQEARLGDGEFVVPADVVSHLGNGSTDAGAKQLYSMMDKVRKARTGRKAQGRQINPQKYMPA